MEITVDRIKEAYQSTGLTPARGVYLDSDRSCACAVGALICEQNGLDWMDQRLDQDIEGQPIGYRGMMKIVGEELGVPPAFVAGLIRGFDSGTDVDLWSMQPFYQDPETRDDFVRGRRIGTQAHKDLGLKGEL